MLHLAFIVAISVWFVSARKMLRHNNLVETRAGKKHARPNINIAQCMRMSMIDKKVGAQSQVRDAQQVLTLVCQGICSIWGTALPIKSGAWQWYRPWRLQ